ncbi:hypothetical protein D3C76_1413660 [compost metagenome]
MGGAVNGEVGGNLADHTDQTQILHNHGIHSRLDAGLHQLAGILQLIFEHEDIKGQKPLHPIHMQKRHNIRQLVHGKVIGPGPGIEFLYAEINGISPVGHRRPHALPISCRRKQLYILAIYVNRHE